MKDMNGKEIDFGSCMVYPKGGSDFPMFECMATVIDPIEETGTVIVTDQDDDQFEVDPDQIAME